MWGLRALAQWGRTADLPHVPNSIHNRCHGLPSRFWELYVPEHGGL